MFSALRLPMAGSGTDERSKLPVEMYLLAGGVGFVFGALVSFANAQITRHSVRKNSANAIMAASILRMLVNIAALAVPDAAERIVDEIEKIW